MSARKQQKVPNDNLVCVIFLKLISILDNHRVYFFLFVHWIDQSFILYTVVDELLTFVKHARIAIFIKELVKRSNKRRKLNAREKQLYNNRINPSILLSTGAGQTSMEV